MDSTARTFVAPTGSWSSVDAVRAMPASIVGVIAPTIAIGAGVRGHRWQAGHQYVERACSPWRRVRISAWHRRQGWPAAAVDGEGAGSGYLADRGAPVGGQVGPQHAGGRRVELAHLAVVEADGRRERVDVAGVADLGLVDVADPAGDPLVEQGHADLGVGRRPRPEPVEHVGQVGAVVDEVGAPARQHRVAAQVGLVEQLDDRRREADGHGVVGLDDGPGRPRRLPPALARPVQVPAAGHLHVRVQDAAVGEPDQQVLAEHLDAHDHQVGGHQLARRTPRSRGSSNRRTGAPTSTGRIVAAAAVDRVALRHGSWAPRSGGRAARRDPRARRATSGSATEHQALVPVAEAVLAAGDRPRVDSRVGPPSMRVSSNLAMRPSFTRSTRAPIQRPSAAASPNVTSVRAAPLEVGRDLAVDEHHVGARRARPAGRRSRATASAAPYGCAGRWRRGPARAAARRRARATARRRSTAPRQRELGGAEPATK